MDGELTVAYLAPQVSLSSNGGSTTHVVEVVTSDTFPVSVLFVKDGSLSNNDIKICAPDFGEFPLASLLSELYMFLYFLIIRPEVDVIYARETFLPTPLILSFLFDTPSVLEVNEAKKVNSLAKNLKLKLKNKIDSRRRNSHDHIIAVSEGIKSHLVNNQNISPEKVTVIKCAVDPKRFKPTSDPAEYIKTDQSYVVYVGNLEPYQGVDVLLEAISLIDCQDLACVIVGDGSERERLETLVYDLGIQNRVEFTGRVQYDLVPEVVSNAMVAVAPLQPNRFTSPLKRYEYLACGTPTITTDIQMNQNLIEKNVVRAVPPNCPAQLADEILTIYNSSHVQNSLAKRGREFVLEHRTWEHAAQDKRVIINEVSQES